MKKTFLTMIAACFAVSSIFAQQNSSNVTQTGNENDIAVEQIGSTNQSLVIQIEDRNISSVTQTGIQNNSDLQITGSDNLVDIVQIGDQNLSASFVTESNVVSTDRAYAYL